MDVKHEGSAPQRGGHSTVSSQGAPDWSEFGDESSAREGEQALVLSDLTLPPAACPAPPRASRPARRRSESSVPLFEPDELQIPPAAVSLDSTVGVRRTNTASSDGALLSESALDSDSPSPASAHVGYSEISTTSPVYSTFAHPNPSTGQSSPSNSSFSSLPPAVISLLPPVAQDSRARSAVSLSRESSENLSPRDDTSHSNLAPESYATFVVPSTATSTPVADSHGAPSEFHTPGSPSTFALPSAAASPLPERFSGTGASQSSTSLNASLREATRRTTFAEDNSCTQRSRFKPSPHRPSSEGNREGAEGKNGAQIDLLSAGSLGFPRNFDVYIGLFGSDHLLVRYAKWMHAELESNGVACFSADRSLYSDQRSHDIARGVLHAATVGVVLVSRKAFKNPYTIEELTIFLDRGNLVPVFFDVAPPDCLVRDIVEKQGEIWEVDGGELWKAYRGEEKGWSEAVEGLLTAEELRVEAYRWNWRESIHKVVGLVGSRLERRSVADREEGANGEELPWPRNAYFAGREKELKALEKMLFSEHGNAVVASSGTVAQTLARGSDASSRAEAEELESRLSNYDSENHEEIAMMWPHQSPHRSEPDRGREGVSGNLKDHSLSSRRGARARSSRDHKRRDSADRRGEGDRTRYSNTCVVTGIPGIGKSELALEFAYRNSQKYRMVLWVGGDSCYLRQNYLNLSTVLGVDVSCKDNLSPERGRVRTFDEQEAEAVQKIRHELQKDVPYLLIIDNLDAERDSWDGREISELLPRPGSATHILITTRLPRVMHLENSLEVPYLSSFEALTLMRDGKKSVRSFSVQQIDKFKEFEDKLRRLPFGLAIVGRLINEFNMKPSDILAKMGIVEFKRTNSKPSMERDDIVLRSNPFLVKLLDLCFNLMAGGSGSKSLAVRMAYVGGWFGPAPCPLVLLALAAKKLEKELVGRTKFMASMLSCWTSRNNGRSEADARDLLTRLGLARVSVRDDCLYFPGIIQVYSQMRGGEPAARSFVRAIRKSGSVVHHYDHFWAATYLACRFGSEPAVVEFQVPDLLVFTRRLVLPLALRAFNTFSRCAAALEVLRVCFAMLEDVEKSYVSQIEDRWDQSLCWRRGASGPHQVDEYVWQDLTLLKAHLLEARAKLLMRGGQYDAGEELCRTCINIRTVMLGADHPETLAAQETLSKFDIRNRK